jgi:hypothetical protein
MVLYDELDDRTSMAVHLLYAGRLLDKHWDVMRHHLPNNIRHELGAEVAKIRAYEALAVRKGE